MSEGAPQIVHVAITPEGMILPPDILHVGPIVHVGVSLFDIVLVSLQKPVSQKGLHALRNGFRLSLRLLSLGIRGVQLSAYHPGQYQGDDTLKAQQRQTNGVDYIISRDVKGFEEDAIPCYSPKEFLENIESGLIKII